MWFSMIRAYGGTQELTNLVCGRPEGGRHDGTSGLFLRTARHSDYGLRNGKESRARIDALLAADRRADAISLFMQLTDPESNRPAESHRPVADHRSPAPIPHP